MTLEGCGKKKMGSDGLDQIVDYLGYCRRLLATTYRGCGVLDKKGAQKTYLQNTKAWMIFIPILIRCRISLLKKLKDSKKEAFLSSQKLARIVTDLKTCLSV